jgi:hypothetical protein
MLPRKLRKLPVLLATTSLRVVNADIRVKDATFRSEARYVAGPEPIDLPIRWIYSGWTSN